MNNLEKAKEMLKEFEFDNSIPENFYEVAFKAAKIASTPNWNSDLSKMKNNELYPVVLKSKKTILGYKNDYGFFDKDGSGISIIAFCELPVFCI